jgi:hypothetical protein
MTLDLPPSILIQFADYQRVLDALNRLDLGFRIGGSMAAGLKLYVLQHDRCDWTDILNLIERLPEGVDWRYLFDRVADDAPLLWSVLQVYDSVPRPHSGRGERIRFGAETQTRRIAGPPRMV